jgi:uncharacterized RmlC-like cupin family protein
MTRSVEKSAGAHVNPGITVVRGEELSPDTAQSGAAVRWSGVDSSLTGATRLWFGRVHNDPGTWSPPHHHGEAETGGFVLSGHARIYFGDDYREYVDLEQGDFVFIPPYLPHIEGNRSETESLEWLTCRTPGNIVVNLDDVEHLKELGQPAG